MKISEISAIALLAAAAAFAAPPSPAQVVSAPIVVRTPSPTQSQKAARGNWLKAEVIHADSNSMVVREESNGMMIHTFTYTPQVQAQMQRILDAGGYQYGDKVKVLYQQGQTVALRVRGKPSKAL
jgi:hypothetical protein